MFPINHHHLRKKRKKEEIKEKEGTSYRKCELVYIYYKTVEAFGVPLYNFISIQYSVFQYFSIVLLIYYFILFYSY